MSRRILLGAAIAAALATHSSTPRAAIDNARIYSGIHYRTSDETGARLGRQVAQFVVHHALR